MKYWTLISMGAGCLLGGVVLGLLGAMNGAAAVLALGVLCTGAARADA